MEYNTIITLVTILYYIGISIYFGHTLINWNETSYDGIIGKTITGVVLATLGLGLIGILSEILII